MNLVERHEDWARFLPTLANLVSGEVTTHK